ncbi:MAG: WbqC family protein [Bacteroidota bacterium]
MTIFPTAYFGSISYFKSLCRAEFPLIEAKEHFMKQTCRTRCSILGANGEQQLSIPVFRKNGSKTAIDEVEISSAEQWQKIHWKSIESAYASAPFFEDYDRELKELIFQEETNLLRFNALVTEKVFALLDISFTCNFTEKFQGANKKNNLCSHDFELPAPIKPYFQVFSDRDEFKPNLSILDVLFNEGPMARNWLLDN